MQTSVDNSAGTILLAEILTEDFAILPNSATFNDNDQDNSKDNKDLNCDVKCLAYFDEKSDNGRGRTQGRSRRK